MTGHSEVITRIQTAQNTVTAQSFGENEAFMARQSRSKRTKVRRNPPKAQFSAGLAEIVSATVRFWRKHHLGYDQTKYVVEPARQRLKLQKLFACHGRRKVSR
jgi:predicted amidophosphoribosyltransferase